MLAIRRFSHAVRADESVGIVCVVRVKNDVNIRVSGRFPLRQRLKRGKAA
jgi:hypothetical protein